MLEESVHSIRSLAFQFCPAKWGGNLGIIWLEFEDACTIKCLIIQSTPVHLVWIFECRLCLEFKGERAGSYAEENS